MIGKRALFAGVALCASIIAGSAQAQDNATAQDAAGESVATGDIIVTAQRRSERLQDVPISVISTSADDLARANISNVRDLQNVVPGLNIVATGSAQQPMLRGITTTNAAAGNDVPVPVYLDGVFQPNQIANNFE